MLSDLLKDPQAFERFVEGQGLGKGQGQGLGQGLGKGGRDRSNSGSSGTKASSSASASARANMKEVVSPFVIDNRNMDDTTNSHSHSPHTDEEDEDDEDDEINDAFPRAFFRHLGLCLLAGTQGQGLGPAQGLGQGPECLADMIECARFKLLVARCLVRDTQHYNTASSHHCISTFILVSYLFIF